MICKRCNGTFECNVEDILHCQCSDVPVDPATTLFLEKTSWGCLCAACLKEVNSIVVSLVGETFPLPGNLKEGYHYYTENGLWVFTERHHMLRGACCKSGCRHCPYGFLK